MMTMTVPHALAATTACTTIGSVGTGMMSANDSTVVGLTEVRMMASPTAMNDPQAPAAVANLRTTMREKTRVTPRYAVVLTLSLSWN